MTKLNWQMVDRYFTGRATAAERVIVGRWLAASPAFRMFVEHLYRSALDDEALREAQAEVRVRLERGMAATTRSARTSRPLCRRLGPVLKARNPRLLQAAVIAALLLGGILLVQEGAKVTHVGQPATALRQVTTPAGERLTVSLSDGSQVILSPGSTLTYAATFGPRRREVHLDGEAYFDVDHDARRPFVVRAGNLVAEDLGTEFVVRAYPEDPYGRVVVRKGLVGVAGATVAPGQLGRLGPNGTPIVEPADTASWFAWTRGRLVFAGMPLRDALPKLNRWYNLEFRLADRSLGEIGLVGAVPEHPDDDALDALGLALGLEVVREGGVVTFRAKSHP